MTDLFVDIGIAAILRILKSKKDVQKWLAALAKIAVRLEETAAVVPDLAAAIEKKRMES